MYYTHHSVIVLKKLGFLPLLKEEHLMLVVAAFLGERWKAVD